MKKLLLLLIISVPLIARSQQYISKIPQERPYEQVLYAVHDQQKKIGLVFYGKRNDFVGSGNEALIYEHKGSLKESTYTLPEEYSKYTPKKAFYLEDDLLIAWVNNNDREFIITSTDQKGNWSNYYFEPKIRKEKYLAIAKVANKPYLITIKKNSSHLNFYPLEKDKAGKQISFPMEGVRFGREMGQNLYFLLKAFNSSPIRVFDGNESNLLKETIDEFKFFETGEKLVLTGDLMKNSTLLVSFDLENESYETSFVSKDFVNFDPNIYSDKSNSYLANGILFQGKVNKKRAFG